MRDSSHLFTTVSLFLLLVAVLLIDLTGADLPSCQRAKCSHCQVQFISRMCPSACGQCFGGKRADCLPDCDSNQNRQLPFAMQGSPTRVATHGQTAFIPNNQPAHNIQQTIPNNAGNGPPVFSAPHSAQAISTVHQQQQPPQSYQQPTSTFQGQQQQPFGQAQQQFPPPPTSALAPYQQPPPAFGTPFSAPSAPPTSPFFNPFLPQPFPAVVPFSGLTFAPPLVPASLSPAFTQAPLIFPPSSTLQPPSAGPIVSQQRAVPSYQPYQQQQRQVPPTLIQPQPQPTYPPSQSYRTQISEQHVSNYNRENAPRIHHTRIRHPTKHYSTAGKAAGGRYSTNSNVNLGAAHGPGPTRYISTYNQQARPKQIHLPPTTGNIQPPPPPQLPAVGSQVSPAPQLLPTNPPPLIQGISQGVAVQTAQLPQPLINNNLPIGNHIDIQENKIDKATCPRQPNWEPCISKELANDRFRNCCLRLGEGCAQLCNYDQNLATLQIAVLTGRCPLGKVADMMICASGYEDATPCCESHGVFDPGFEHCRPYCNPAAGLPNDGMIAEKYRCLGKLSQIQRCFYVTQRP